MAVTVWVVPLFDRIEIALQPDFYPLNIANTFVIDVQRNSEDDIYFKSMTLNKQTTADLYLSHDSIVDGGLLELSLEPISLIP